MERIDPDSLNNVCTYLSLSDLVSLMLCCKKVQELIYRQDRFWIDRYQRFICEGWRLFASPLFLKQSRLRHLIAPRRLEEIQNHRTRYVQLIRWFFLFGIHREYYFCDSLNRSRMRINMFRCNITNRIFL